MLFVGCSKNITPATMGYASYLDKAAYHADNESPFFNRWIAVPNNCKSDFRRLSEKRFAKRFKECKTANKGIDLIAVVKIEKFKILPYRDADNERLVRFEAKVQRVLQGRYTHKKITYYMSTEVGDSIGEVSHCKHTVFLSKEKDVRARVAL